MDHLGVCGGRGDNFILSQNTYKAWKYAVHNTDSSHMVYLTMI